MTKRKRAAAAACSAAVWLFATGFGWRVEQDVNVRTGPSAQADRLGYLERDEEICVLQAQDEWAKIIFQGHTGYVSLHYLEELDYEVALKLQYEEPMVIDVLGDSITYGNLLEDRQDAYPAVLGRLCGARVNNYGVCATTVAINNEDSFLERYSAMERDANLILVMGGTNDFGLSTPLGSMEDLSPGCFYGGLHDLLSGLEAGYPGVPVIFLTPMQREKQELPNQQGLLLADYVNAIRQVCAAHGVYVLDLFAQESLNFRDQMPLYMPDGLHPNTAGHALLADYIYESLFVEAPESAPPRDDNGGAKIRTVCKSGAN